MSQSPNHGLVIVTGGASGIGRASVEHLLAEGWRVAILDLAGPALDNARAEFAGNSAVVIEVADVTDEAAMTVLVARIDADHGPIEGLVNSAGIARDIPALETSAELFRKVLDVNVVGSFIMAKAAALVMRTRGRGAIVNLASVSGLRGSKGRVAYGSSKGAVVTMTQVLANDLAPLGIRVNAVAPGPVDTPMVKAMHTARDRETWLTYVPMNRYAEPAEIAPAIAFLLDETRASFITGEVLAIDGGFRGAGIIARG